MNFFQRCNSVTALRGPGLVVTDRKAQLALTRLAVCLEELYDCGLQEARFWILPICRK